MDFLVQKLNDIASLGAMIMMPIIITVFALILRVKLGKAIRAGLTVGVGFVGLNMVIGLLGGAIGPAAQKMVTNMGLNLTVIDVGWPSASAIAIGTKIGALIIPLCLSVNIIMLLTKTTQTVVVDIWNFWHFAFTGALVMGITGSLGYGLAAAALNMMIIQVIADLTAPGVEKYLGFEGISMPHGFSAAYVPIAIVINKLIDMIPVINKIDFDLETVKDKIGAIGEPVIMGTIIGVGIGFAAGYEFKQIAELGIQLGAALVLMPKMAALLMEGLMPVSEAAQALIQSKFGSRGKLYIGIDSAIGVGHQAALTVAILMIPITILLAIIIPGNNLLPFADLATIPFALVLIIPVTRGNVFRTLIIAIIIMSAGLLIATNLAPIHTLMAIEAGFELPKGANLISSICDGSNPMSWIFAKMSEFKEVGIGIMAIVAFGLALFNRRRIKNQEI